MIIDEYSDKDSVEDLEADEDLTIKEEPEVKFKEGETDPTKEVDYDPDEIEHLDCNNYEADMVSYRKRTAKREKSFMEHLYPVKPSENPGEKIAKEHGKDVMNIKKDADEEAYIYEVMFNYKTGTIETIPVSKYASDRVEITIPMINLGEHLMHDEIPNDKGKKAVEMVVNAAEMNKIANRHAEKIAIKMEAGPLNENKEPNKFYDPWCNCCNQPEPAKDEHGEKNRDHEYAAIAGIDLSAIAFDPGPSLRNTQEDRMNQDGTVKLVMKNKSAKGSDDA